MRHSKPVRLETAPTGGESVYLFLEFTIKSPNPLNLPDKSGQVGFKATCLSPLIRGVQGDFDKCLLISRVY